MKKRESAFVKHVNRSGEESVDIFELCRKCGVILGPYSDPKVRELFSVLGFDSFVKDLDCFSLTYKGDLIIFWDDKLPLEQQRAAVAREFGVAPISTEIREKEGDMER